MSSPHNLYIVCALSLPYSFFLSGAEVFVGPGLSSYIATFFFLLFVTVIHVMTPVPPDGPTTEALMGGDIMGDEDAYKPYEESLK